ncbi:MAG TPA: trimethylamine methyltransferase family protein [Thermoleophilia bacterium]
MKRNPHAGRRRSGGLSLSVFTEDELERVGIGGDFLKEKMTTKRLRAGEHFMPVVSSRQAYGQWKADGRDEVARARERMDALLAARAERPRPLNAEQLSELAAVCGVTPAVASALGH